MVATLEKKHFLIDLNHPKSLTIPLNFDENYKFTSIKFNFGIDSLTNVSGALDGDLDPTNGMYWTWQSGYINLKLEGTSSNCPARKNKFQFHLGGYLAPFYGLREIEIPIQQTDPLKIEIDFAQFLRPINLAEIYQIMSPNTDAMILANELSELFKIKL